jgi:hypothetical protein
VPERIQRQRTKGWRKPEGAIYVGPPTRWGNPWRVPLLLEGPHTYQYDLLASPKHPDWYVGQALVNITPALAVALYDAWIHEEGRAVIVREHLRGYDLVCWCPLGSPCHADVLLEVAAL